jgi:hypothetical protein
MPQLSESSSKSECLPIVTAWHQEGYGTKFVCLRRLQTSQALYNQHCTVRHQHMQYIHLLQHSQ